MLSANDGCMFEFETQRSCVCSHRRCDDGVASQTAGAVIHCCWECVESHKSPGPGTQTTNPLKVVPAGTSTWGFIGGSNTGLGTCGIVPCRPYKGSTLDNSSGL